MSAEPLSTQDDAARILVVDDEPVHVKALCDVLSSRGHESVGATSAEEALAMLRETKCHLLLVDLIMPGMDGIALLRSALELDPDIIGIIMTGEGTIATAVEAMKTGALDYVLKPLRLSLVLPVVSRALSVQRVRVANKELGRSLHERTTQLELANKELELANKELESFAYSVSHDLRAPLRTIEGFARTLEQEFAPAMPEEARGLVDRIVQGADKMDHLIEDMLRFARMSRRPVSRQPVDVGELVREVVEQLSILHGSEIRIQIADLPHASADPALLRQVFTNLLSNALKFTRKRSDRLIEVGAEPQGSAVAYFVRDNGVGFDMRYANRMFGVFQRLHSESEFEGTGVGLSIVQRIVLRHGGRVWAHSEVGKGAIFRFTLEDGSSSGASGS